MKLQKSKKADVNYLARVVELKDFTKHPNPEVTRMKVAHIEGFSICVGIDEQPGLYVYFPTLSQINPNLLSYCNLYSDTARNANPEDKPGFFDKNGRVKAIRLKGMASEGFLLPYSKLQDWILSEVNVELPEMSDGTEFDEAEHNGKSFWICKKYVVRTQVSSYDKERRSRHDKQLKRFDRIREDQFRFHYDTVLLRKEPHVIGPNDIIHISSKWHGTSGISAYVLCHQKLNWKQKIAKWLTGETFDKYDYIYSSRTVIKNKYLNKNAGSGFYGCDVWAEADKVLKPFLIKGMTLYYEIVGFLPNGGYIQKNYDYGCVAPKQNVDGTVDYKEGVNFKIYIYRITTTNVDGITHEWSTREVQQWCKAKGLRPVEEFYYGYARDLYPDLAPAEHWCENFLERLANDKNFYMEQNSPDCNNKVPHEGIVIKKEDGIAHAWKLKSFAFLNKEQQAADKGESNIEDEA